MAGAAGMTGHAMSVHDGHCCLIADLRAVGVRGSDRRRRCDNPDKPDRQQSRDYQYPGAVDLTMSQVEVVPCKGGNETDGGENSPTVGVTVEKRVMVADHDEDDR